MYEVYLGTTLLPVAPSKIETKIKNQNKTVQLINFSEVNLLTSPGLTEFNFEVLLPNSEYHFSKYIGGFKPADFFLNILEDLKVEKKPFQFKVIRQFPDGRDLFTTDISVSLEEYSIIEEDKHGFDVVAKIKLKQYREYKLKEIKINKKKKKAKIKKKRPASTSPEPKSKPKKYTVVRGDTLWGIAKRTYGDGLKYKDIAKVNKISNPNRIYPGQKLILPVLKKR